MNDMCNVEVSADRDGLIGSRSVRTCKQGVINPDVSASGFRRHHRCHRFYLRKDLSFHRSHIHMVDSESPAAELDALMGGDNQQATDPTRPGDSPAFYLALVCLPLTFCYYPLSASPLRHQHLSVVLSPQLAPFSLFTGFGSLDMDHHIVQ